MVRLNELYAEQKNLEVLGVKTDSRLVEQGDLFICIKGYTVDGHDYAKIAQEKGAVAIVAERELEGIAVPVVVVDDTSKELARVCDVFYHSPSKRIAVHGITGTNGKTTTACALSNILNMCSKNTGYIGTNGIIYNEVTKNNSNTTPDALTLNGVLDEMLNNEVSQVALEVSSHALALNRTAFVEFKTAIFTNLTPEHLDFHPDMEDYYQTKKKLFTQLHKNGAAVINIDDEYGKRLSKDLKNQARLITFGQSEMASVRIKNISYLESGTKFVLETDSNNYEVHSPLIGEFNVYNVVGAMLGAFAENQESLTLPEIIQAVARLKTIDGRMELINEGQDFTVIVDYAHTPDGVEQLLKCATKLGKDKIKLVIGCPGDRDRTKRPVIAKIATSYADEVIFTTDDPHSEEPTAILEEMTTDLRAENYKTIIDRTTAIKEAIQTMKKNELLIVAGRGHQKLQYWSTGNIELDDREVTKSILKSI